MHVRFAPKAGMRELRRENRLKLAKVMVSQKTNTARNGTGMELPA